MAEKEYWCAIEVLTGAIGGKYVVPRRSYSKSSSTARAMRGPSSRSSRYSPRGSGTILVKALQ
jgi:hypothetical protein